MSAIAPLTTETASSGTDFKKGSLRTSTARVSSPEAWTEPSWQFSSHADCRSACNVATRKVSVLTMLLCKDSRGVVVDDTRCATKRPMHTKCRCDTLGGELPSSSLGSWFAIGACAGVVVFAIAAAFCLCTAVCRRQTRAKAAGGRCRDLLTDGEVGPHAQGLKRATPVPAGVGSSDKAVHSTLTGSINMGGSSADSSRVSACTATDNRTMGVTPRASAVLPDLFLARVDTSMSGRLTCPVTTPSGSSSLDGAVASVSRGVEWFDAHVDGANEVLELAQGRLANLLPGLDRAKKVLSQRPSSDKPFIAELENSLLAVETLLEQYKHPDSLQNLTRFRNRFSVCMQSVERPYTDLLLDINGLIIEATSRILGKSWVADCFRPDVDSPTDLEAQLQQAIGAKNPRRVMQESPCSIPFGPFSPSDTSSAQNGASPSVHGASEACQLSARSLPPSIELVEEPSVGRGGMLRAKEPLVEESPLQMTIETNVTVATDVKDVSEVPEVLQEDFCIEVAELEGLEGAGVGREGAPRVGGRAVCPGSRVVPR